MKLDDSSPFFCKLLATFSPFFDHISPVRVTYAVSCNIHFNNILSSVHRCFKRHLSPTTFSRQNFLWLFRITVDLLHFVLLHLEEVWFDANLADDIFCCWGKIRQDISWNSNTSPIRCNNFSVYYPDVYLQLNMFRAFSLPSSGAQWLQWQPLVLPSYRGDSRAVFMVGPADRPDHEHNTTVTTIRR